MKNSILMTFILVCIIPSMLLCFFERSENLEQAPVEEQLQENTQENDAEKENTQIYVKLLKDDKIEVMSLDTYVFGVVLAEMPADFELEALKAQAVVARTYTCKKMENPKHSNADVCTDSACCQAYMDEFSYLLAGGTNESLQKVRSAVKTTQSEVLKYDGKLIEATYFSCSGGKTEDAAEVWGADVPYLQAVSSPGEEKASHYTDTVKFTAKEFANMLDISSEGSPGKWVENITYTEGGGVHTIVIQGKTFTGTEIRQKLGLRSTAFVISIAGNSVTVTTKGFGHRVGMSQYGADAMAVQGSLYQDILYHYYTGVTLSNLSG